MRGYFASIIAFAAIVPSIALARYDDIPNLDMRPVCRGIASQSADPGVGQGGQADTFQRCIESEREVREQLKKEWSAFSAADKRHCVELAKTGGESSNTELLTCLEMSRDVRVLRAAAEKGKSSAAAADLSKPSPPAADLAKPAPSLSTPATPPSPAEAGSKLATKTEADQANKDAERAKADALAAKASEAVVQRKLADAEAALKRAKDELDRAKAEAERAKADAQGARESAAAANRKLADAEVARAAAEKACPSGDTAQPGLGSRLRRWLGRPAPNP
jgi:hypothetical protein